LKVAEERPPLAPDVQDDIASTMQCDVVLAALTGIATFYWYALRTDGITDKVCSCGPLRARS